MFSILIILNCCATVLLSFNGVVCISIEHPLLHFIRCWKTFRSSYGFFSLAALRLEASMQSQQTLTVSAVVNLETD